MTVIYVYHVTSAADVDAIQTEGLRSRGRPDYYSPRYELDLVADRIGEELYDDWVSRVHGVYFWETIEQARAETETDIYDRVVEVDTARIGTPLWQLPSDAWEQVYAAVERPYQIERGTEEWNRVRDVVELAERYDSQPTGVNEVWTRGPVSPEAIVHVREL